ncbi:MAG: hypothetical protein DRN92_09215 [Thermoproteota archaeon]|nr:MAG: hypothetical protein DRN92_09215 [Candidatus Korarchaeota archaeon]
MLEEFSYLQGSSPQETLITYDPYSGLPRFNPAGIGIGLVLLIIGYVIILLGSLATFFKIASEVIAEEVESRLGRTGG